MSENATDKRKLNLIDCVAILINVIIGSGIFYLGSLVLMSTGMNLGWSIICWIIGGVVSILGGFIYAELGTSIFDKRGVSTSNIYLNEAYHPFLGYLTNIMSVFISSPAATASFAIAFFTAYKTQFGMSDMGVKIASIIMIIVVGILNLNDAKTGALIARFTTVLKLAPIFLILVGGLFLGGVKPDLSLVVEEASGSSLIMMIALGVNASLWAYSGYTMVSPLSADMKDPKKDIPRSIVFSVLGVTTLYAVFTYAIYRVLSVEEMGAMVAAGDLYIGTAAATKLFSFGGLLVTLCIMVSVFGSFNSSMMIAARGQAVLGRSGRFPEVFAKENKNGVPIGPILTQVGIGSLFVIFSGLQGLTQLNVFIGNITNVLVILAVPIFRKKYPDINRPFKVPCFWVTIIAYSVINALLMISAVISDPSTIALSGIAVVIAGIFWFAFDPKRKKA